MARRIGLELTPATIRIAIHKLRRVIAVVLSAEQQGALELWAANESFEDIARTLGLADPIEARRLVRSALERLGCLRP